MEPLIVTTVVVVLVVMVIAKTAIVVPQQSAYVVEYLGKYRKTIKAGFHILIPFVERVAYKHNLKEGAVDIQEQICITRDNVQVGVDGGSLPESTRRPTRLLRNWRLHLCHRPARPDDPAERDRKNRPRSHV